MDKEASAPKDARKTVVIASYGSVIGDPPARNAARAFLDIGWKVIAIQFRAAKPVLHDPLAGLEERGVPFTALLRAGLIGRLLHLASFVIAVALTLRRRKPDVFISIMFAPMAFFSRKRPAQISVGAVFDIPSPGKTIGLSELITRRGWKRLKKMDLVWASDPFKGRLAQKLGKLPKPPIVCYNCPPREYLPEPTWPRDPWLRCELQQHGATINDQGGCILLRAGAVGECGGIEETLDVMRDLPSDFLFLLMSRVDERYAKHVRHLITAYGLHRRAFLWEQPNDEVWKRALRGGDLGHLIQGPFPPGRTARLYELNSSLSNNRLFQYMAAGLPIIAYDDPRMNDLYAEVDCFRVARLENLKEDLRNIIGELGGSSTARQTLGTRAREAHLRKYHWERQFEPVLGALQQSLQA